MDFYANNPGSAYGLWILIAEIGICGIIPAAILISDRGRKTQATLWLAIVLAVVGVSLNRWVMVLQVLAVPVLSFETWNLYFPSWQEIATTILPVALGIICISISYRYLPIFPQERELNPIETAADDVASPETIEPPEIAEGELEPAEA
jgi:molybdopterin-containing oxidoreductase family membrane subunit